MNFFRKSKISLGFQMPFGIQIEVVGLILANFDFWPLPKADIRGNSPKKDKMKEFPCIPSHKERKSLSSLDNFVFYHVLVYCSPLCNYKNRTRAAKIVKIGQIFGKIARKRPKLQISLIFWDIWWASLFLIWIISFLVSQKVPEPP